jgi:alpha-N-arabinofuranosidase
MAQKLAFRHLRAIQYRILRRSQFRRTFLFALQAGSSLVRSLLASLTLLAVAVTVPVAAAQKVQMSVDVSRAGAKIDRNLFGQFAEHLGHGVYEGIWVGPDSEIPTTRGIRNDVVAALRALKVPNVRWPRCRADKYHCAKRIVSAANGNTQSTGAGAIEGEHLRDKPNSWTSSTRLARGKAYLSVVGSGTHGSIEWFEYLTTAQPTTVAKERAPAWHLLLIRLRFWHRQQSWTGSNMTPRLLSKPAQDLQPLRPQLQSSTADKQQMLKIAVGRRQRNRGSWSGPALS